MDLRINKPRVFLSHSKADATFIEQVHSDLRKCQIEPWLDSEEIRHGKPWLDAIFEYGIPTCDAVLVYFTEASLESKMVKKEMDAGILQQLKDQRVAFLPYVHNETIRTKLRSDIQALQVPVWNPANYKDIIPQVVAEIWRSYLERMIASAVQDERVKRLQAELELEKIKKDNSGSIFSPSEEAEFRYIWDAINRSIPIEVEEYMRKSDSLGRVTEDVLVRKYKLEVKLSTVISVLIGERLRFDFGRFLTKHAMKILTKSGGPGDPKNIYVVKKFPEIQDDLLMYGFIELTYDSPRPRPMIIKKGYRFRYWLAFNQILPSSVDFGKIEISDSDMRN